MCLYFKKKNKTLSKSLQMIKKDLKNNKKRSLKITDLHPEDVMLIQRIKHWTSLLNKNNVTRTKAYLHFYHLHPEIHWSFLGHMVSRNGGWNITDLKGGLLTRLLSKEERNSYFMFLERGNWLIFQDIYPQFLLYEESKKRGMNLFYLLPFFHVSFFMKTIWNYFWRTNDTYTLAIGLVINEQSYLESRVVESPVNKKEVFNTIEFKLQEILAMNHIVFPFEKDGQIKLVGQTLRHFESLHERILLGKRLYSIIFDNHTTHSYLLEWAHNVPHTGSRKDYWPHIYNSVNEGNPGISLKPRLWNCKINSNSPRIYSPMLELAWKNQEHLPAEIEDWYKDWRVIHYLDRSEEKIDGEIENDYCKTLERLELASITKKAISILG